MPRDVPTKRVSTGAGSYVIVVIARKPPAIAQEDWDRLSRINDYIIDHVRYDYAKLRAPTRRLQTPEETLRLGRGVCSDYSALFEALARRAGYTVTSLTSAQINHAWNAVKLAGHWWMVDVTWNDGEIFSTGEPLPASLRRDSDFRKEYFLITLAEEKRRRRLGLIRSTHLASDIEPVDYARPSRGG
jgi:transglutaminase/protease-like cytokinesis protein 3